MIYLLYRNRMTDRPIAAFVNREDAEIVCAAINAADTVDHADPDFWLAYVAEMPVVGGWR